MSEPRQWRDARNILCVRLDNLGDVLMTIPAIRALRLGRADRRITLLASSAGREVATLVPEIDAVIGYDAAWMKGSPEGAAARDLEMRDTLARGTFDAAVVFTVYSQSALPAALLTYLAGIPLRAAHCRENPYGLLTHWVRETEPDHGVRHEVRRQLDLVTSLGAGSLDAPGRLHVPDESHTSVARRLEAHGVRSDEIVVVHPGASAPSRRYPPERFAAVIDALLARRNCCVVVTGTRGERDVVEAACHGAARSERVVGWAGTLELAELAALIARSQLLISNNSGPVHLASSLGTPVVDLYALTNPQHGPWNVPHRVLFQDVPCRFCYRSVCPQGHHQCLLGVAVSDVVAAACALLDRDQANDEGSSLQPLPLSANIGRFSGRREAA